MRPRSYRTLYDVSGLYVIQFDDRVKVGMSQDLRMRLRQHGKAGGIHARAWSVAQDHRRRAEDDAIAALEVIGQRSHPRSESFTGVTFGQAVDVMRSAIVRHAGGPVHEVGGFTADLVVPMPLSNGWRYGWDGSHLLGAVS